MLVRSILRDTISRFNLHLKSLCSYDLFEMLKFTEIYATSQWTNMFNPVTVSLFCTLSPIRDPYEIENTGITNILQNSVVSTDKQLFYTSTVRSDQARSYHGWHINNSHYFFDVHVTVHRDTFLIIKPTTWTNFSNLFLEWNSTCFGQFLCPSSGVFHCTQQWYMSYRFADSLQAGSG